MSYLYGPIVRKYVSPDPNNPFASGGEVVLAIIAPAIPFSQLDNTGSFDVYSLGDLMRAIQWIDSLNAESNPNLTSSADGRNSLDELKDIFNMADIYLSDVVFEFLQFRIRSQEEFAPCSIIDAYLLNQNGLFSAADQNAANTIYGNDWRMQAKAEINDRRPLVEASQQNNKAIEADWNKISTGGMEAILDVFLSGMEPSPLNELFSTGSDSATKALQARDEALIAKGWHVTPFAINESWPAQSRASAVALKQDI